MGMTQRMFFTRLAILLLSVGFTLFPGRSESQNPTEYQVKGAFIYNFAKFVEWPAGIPAGGRPFIIGIFGKDPFGSLIDEAVSGKNVRDRKIAVKRFSRIDEAVDSQILFISSSEAESVPRILKELGRTPMLTVSDIDRFAEQGGMVQLLMDQNRVRFAINVAAVERAGLRPSSQLLKLARIVPEGGAKNEMPPEEGFAGHFLYGPLQMVYSMDLRKIMRFDEYSPTGPNH